MTAGSILGIGSGWFEKDYTEYGYEFGTAGGRLNDLADSLPRIESRWAKLNPAPTRKIPVLIGGGGEKKTLRLVAQHGDIWHSFADLETFKRKSGVLDDWCAAGRPEPGRDPALGRHPRWRPGQVGPPLVEAGASLFTVGIGGPDYDLSQAQAVDRLAQHPVARPALCGPTCATRRRAVQAVAAQWLRDGRGVAVSARAAVIVTGTEVLTGRVADRNGPWLAEQLRQHGVDIAQVIVVGDRPDDLRSSLAFVDRVDLSSLPVAWDRPLTI